MGLALRRFTKQLKLKTVVDRESINPVQLAAEGGVDRLNKAFDGNMEDLQEKIQEEVWNEPA